MSGVLKSVVDHFASSPAPKRMRSVGSAASEQKTNAGNMQRGLKRKSDIYDVDGVEGDGSPVSTPTTRTKSRRASEAPPSSARSRQSTAKSKRYSGAKRPSLASNATPTTRQTRSEVTVDSGNQEPSAGVRAPLADMGSANILVQQAEPEPKPAVYESAESTPVSEKPASERSARKRPASERSAKKPTTSEKPANEKPTEKPQATQSQEEEVHEIKKLVNHKVADSDPGRIVLLVEWVDDPEHTWEPEEEIQDGASEMLLDYWKKQGGRSAALFEKGSPPLLKEQYWVYKILKHERLRSSFRFEVQWVGYPADNVNTSWESESKLKNIAPEILSEYWETQGGRDKFLAKRAKAKKRRTN